MLISKLLHVSTGPWHQMWYGWLGSYRWWLPCGYTENCWFVWLSTARSRIHGNYLSIFVRVASVALGSQSITMTSQWASWRVPNQQQLDGLSNYLFKLTSNKTTKIRVIGPLWGQSTGERWIPLTEGPVMRKAYPLCDVIMHTTLQM